MDYWIRLNKAIDVTSVEVVMMFISHCPDPSLAMSFQFKPVELWTAAEVQERLDGHVRNLRSTAALAQHVVNTATWARESTAPAPHCGIQHQPPVMVAPPLVTPMPATASAPSASVTSRVGRSVSSISSCAYCARCAYCRCGRPAGCCSA
ncbi:hypothetical protein NHX12_001774 [Muraenolepis orangiensis]|uniref:Uncharacterized protein n=1 Tax=Muraenolepis orangiensis TaxID=630683 RepID=A0A9Q0E361_9TELE|nr:hypothetical protein NHX12_001774 [Muraenolepis orangiensis]